MTGADDKPLFLDEVRSWIAHARGEGSLHVAIPVQAAEDLVTQLVEARAELRTAYRRMPEAPRGSGRCVVCGKKVRDRFADGTCAWCGL